MGPINRTTLSQQVANAIKDFIIDRQLAPGDKLPSERELSQYFQVSRIVIREALRALSMAGVVSVEHGKGTFVKRFDGRAVAEQLTYGLPDESGVFEQMLELRTLLECGAIELVAARATEADFARLRDILGQMRAAAERGRPTQELDIAFHRTLLESAKNPPLSRLGRVITEFFRLRNLSFPPSITSTPAEQELREHEEILEAIQRGDTEEAKGKLKQALAVYHVWEQGG